MSLRFSYAALFAAACVVTLYLQYRAWRIDAATVRVIYAGHAVECSYIGKRALATIIVHQDGSVELSDGQGSVTFEMATARRMADAINQLPDWRCKVKP